MSAAAGPANTAESGGLLRLGQILRTRWWIVLLAAVVCVVIAAVLTVKAAKQYTAVAKLNFSQNELISEVGGTESVSANPEADAATNLQVVVTAKVARGVIKALKLDTTPSALLGQVTTTTDNASNIVDVTVVDSDPNEAAKIADAFANVYVAQSHAENLAQLQAGENQLTQQLAQLPRTSANSDTRTNLLQSLQKLQTLAAVQSGNAQVTDYAAVPGAPSSPKTKVNIAVGLIFGILLGIGIAVLLNFLDRHLKNVEDFEELYGVRALATIPWSGGEGRRPGAMTEIAATEQFMILRTGLSVLRPRSEPRVVLVTSAVPGEGKTTVAVGLARAAAAFGQNTILVDADVRRPRINSRLQLDTASAGLTAALMRDVPMSRLLASVVDAPRLRVITSGPHPLNPVALLGSEQMGELIAQLAAMADLVIIDAPPLLPVADTDALLDHPQIDAFVMVGRPGLTTQDEVRAARRRLARRDISRMGLVVNGVTALAGGEAYYGTGLTLEAKDTPAQEEMTPDLALAPSRVPRRPRERVKRP